MARSFISICLFLLAPMVADAQYTGPDLRIPLQPGGQILVTVEAGGVIMQGLGGGIDQWHTGNGFYSLDFDNRFEGDFAVAAAGGTVTRLNNGPCSQWGPTCLVEIDHGSGYQTRYLHLVQGSISVSVGQTVIRGQVLGVIGTTGQSSGTHLHFELKHNVDGHHLTEELEGVMLDGVRFVDYRAGRWYESTNMYSPPPNPHLCGNEPQGGEHTNFIYSCSNVLDRASEVVEDQPLWILYRVDNPRADHRVLVNGFHETGALRHWQWENRDVADVGGWQYAYFWPRFDDLETGLWVFHFFVGFWEQSQQRFVFPDLPNAAISFIVHPAARVAGVGGSPPDEDPDAGAIDLDAAPPSPEQPRDAGPEPDPGPEPQPIGPPFVVWQEAETCLEPLRYGWPLRCGIPQSVFPTGSTINGVFSISRVTVPQHRFLIIATRNGQEVLRRLQAWRAPDDVPENRDRISSTYATLADFQTEAGNWQFRFFVDTGEGFSAAPTGVVTFTVQAPAPPPPRFRFNANNGANPYFCGDPPTPALNWKNFSWCEDRRTVFHAGEDIYAMFRIDTVETDHTFRATLHRVGSAVVGGTWEEYRSLALEDGEVTQLHSFFSPQIGPLDPGEWEVQFFVDQDENASETPVTIARFTVQAPLDCHEDLWLGNVHYCRPWCQCAAGEGGCYRHTECLPGTRCIQNSGRRFDFSDEVAVCVATQDITCHRFPSGHANHCSSQCQCAQDEGDCDNDSECQAGLVCRPLQGAIYGWYERTDVCLPP